MRTRSVFVGLFVLLPIAASARIASLAGAAPLAAPAGFDVVSISVPDGSVWQINRPFEIAFNANVDFASVNPNTVQVRSRAGEPAVGEFYLVDARTIGFQPACPTSADFSDAGLDVATPYTIFLPGTGGGSPTVVSRSGRELSQTHTVHFRTPNSTSPEVLFYDVASGPPRPVIRTSPTQLSACFLRIAEDPAQDVYFVPRAVADPELGANVPAGFIAPLNLYSALATRIAAYVQINQPIDGTPANVDADRVKLEYLTGAGVWVVLPHEVELVENCTQAGALVRVAPVGILPQNKLVRVVLAPGFSDIVGQALVAKVVVGAFLVTTVVDPGTTTPGDGGDEVLEEFDVGGGGADSLEDTSAASRYGAALWGNGRLTASFAAFEGTGGAGGDFDWTIGNGSQPGTVLILDTVFSIITNEQQTMQQTVINGIVDVRDFTISEFSTLLIQGPNPCQILASGSARIDGEIRLKGGSNLSVHTLNTTNQREEGAPGPAGGGRGGAGNPLTTQSSPGGETGFGAFSVPGGGGQGGESGFNPNFPVDFDDEHRRPAGGGGGVLGANVLRPAGIAAGYTNPNACADQQVIGLDAEMGFSGYRGNTGPPTFAPAVGAISGSSPPRGGMPGPGPFANADSTDDFWGTMRTRAGATIRGELARPWAGAGGGGGGNAIVSNSFPTTPFDCCGFYSDEKGAGGGGGGGSFTIRALGSIAFGPKGRINASGGTGGGGENSQAGGTTHIGGGSGGGSGGHVVLESATRIDLSQCRSTGNPAGGIYALGGEGGAGANNIGGAIPGGIPYQPFLDALSPPALHYPLSAPCAVISGQAGYTFTNASGDVVCCGGDGGAGLIQLHAPTLADILPPAEPGENIYSLVKPPPVGSFSAGVVPDYTTINTPVLWDQLLPAFGRRSQAVSKWIALGAASVDPSSPSPDPVEFSFSGTGPQGHVRTTGSGPAAGVPLLPPNFQGVLALAPTRPYVAADLRTLVVDGSTVSDDVYLRAPALTRRFALRLTQGTTDEFDVGAAVYDPSTSDLRLTVSESGTPLAGYTPGTAVELSPRFFRVATNGVADSLPDSTRIRIEFQATTTTADGDPDVGGTSAWTSDLTALDPNVPPNPDYGFVRFRVSFDVSVDGAPLSPFTPVPSLDFLRLPFRF